MARPREADKQWLKSTSADHEDEFALWMATRHKYEELAIDIEDYFLNNSKPSPKVFLRHFRELGLVLSRGDQASKTMQRRLEECPIGGNR